VLFAGSGRTVVFAGTGRTVVLFLEALRGIRARTLPVHPCTPLVHPRTHIVHSRTNLVHPRTLRRAFSGLFRPKMPSPSPASAGLKGSPRLFSVEGAATDTLVSYFQGFLFLRQDPYS
jgi:hypothetical protein